MRKPNPQYIKRVKQIINKSPYYSLLSMELLDLGAGYSVVRIGVEKKHLQSSGFVQGGVYSSMIDAATFLSITFDIADKNAGAVSVDLKLNYLAPASSGNIIARGRRIKVGKTLAYAEAEITREDNGLLAHGTSTLIITPARGFSDDAPMPPKFL